MALKSNITDLIAEIRHHLNLSRGRILSLEEIETWFHRCDTTVKALEETTKQEAGSIAQKPATNLSSTRSELLSLTRYFILLYNHHLFQPIDNDECLLYLERSFQIIQRLDEDGEDLSAGDSIPAHLDWQYFIRGDRKTIASYGEIILKDRVARHLLRDYIQLDWQSRLEGNRSSAPPGI